jgi:hypothetical protein
MNEMSQEEIDELYEDACIGCIFWKYLDELEQGEGLDDVVKRMLEEFYDFMASTDEVVH